MHSVLLILAGIAGGFANTFAAGGSIFQIPALVALGLHPMIANTTNHVPVLIGFAVAVWRFHRQGTIEWGHGLRISVPMVAGAVLGSLTASVIHDRATNYVLLAALAIALVLMIAKPDRWIGAATQELHIRLGPGMLLLYLAIGFWTGLIVIGSGVFLLLALVMVAGFPIAQANAIKALSLGIALLLSVILLVTRGQIVWSSAIPLSCGSILGSMIATRFVTRAGSGKWVYFLILLTLGTEIFNLGSKMFR